jgi:hypothetical protein
MINIPFAKAVLIAATILGAVTIPLSARQAPCPFDETKMQFEGTPLEQAKCLLRPVRRYAILGKPLAQLPSPLEELIGQPIAIEAAQLQKYLALKQINEADIGGAVTNSLAAKYFVIHDVSAPNYREKPFPDNINDASWSVNSVERWRKSKAAHVFVTRVGESVAPFEFVVPRTGTKLEVRVLGEKARGLFVHVELVQPRRSYPKGRPGNDALAPDPGFTEPQLDRLALIYVAASVQHGSWMIPGFHACVDAGIPSAHDDPQNFDLELWAKRLGLLLEALDAT